jgi:uncharacterized membrane protein YoaK (UPF0700 family)
MTDSTTRAGLQAGFSDLFEESDTDLEVEGTIPAWVTGALVRIGKRIATAIVGGDRFGWISPATLFVGMIIGATLGAMMQMALGPRALWVAVAAMLALTLASHWLPGGAADPLDIDSGT